MNISDETTEQMASGKKVIAGKSRPFYKAWLPSFLVFIAYGLGVFGLNWWLVSSPGGGALLGVTVGAADMIAVVVVVLLSGIIDRTDRRAFLLRVQAILLICFLLLLPAFIGGPEIAMLVPIVVLVYLILEGTHSIHQAILETTLIDLAPDEWASSRTASLLQLQLQSARMIAPLAGGYLISLGLLWLLPVLGFVAVVLTSLTLLIWASVYANVTPAGSSDEENTIRPRAMLRTSLRDAREALAWIRHLPVLIFMLIIGFLNNLIVFPFYTLLPAFLMERNIEDAAVVYGWAAGGYGGGMLLSTFLIARFAKQTARPIGVVSATTLAIVAVLGLASFTTNPIVIVSCTSILGVLFVVLIAVAGGAWIDRTPAEVRARVFSLRRLAMFTSIPLGTSLMGFGGAAFGFDVTLRVLLCVVVVAMPLCWIAMRMAFSASEGD